MSLEALSNEFLKQAGLIKVPTEALQQAQDFAISCLAADLVAKLSPQLKNLTIRNRTVNQVSNNLKLWQRDLNLISRSIITENPIYLDQIIELRQNKGFPTIPAISPTKRDKKTQLEGTISPNKNFLHFVLYKNSKNSYYVELEINTPDHSSLEGIHLQDMENNASPEEVFNFFHKYEDKITRSLDILDDLRFEIQYPDPEYLKSRTTLLHYLNKFAAPRLEDYHTGTTITIPLKDLPYQTNLQIPSINFNLIFTANKLEKESIYPSEDWTGLWSKNSQINPSGYIGDIYIAKDIDPDSLGDFTSLKRIFEEVKDTVRHEAQHLIQTFISFATNNPHAGGPRKFKDPNYNFLGVGEHPPLQERLPHAQRDVEFYTDLTDSIQRFTAAKSKLPLKLHKSYAALWTHQIQDLQFMENVERFAHSKPMTPEEKDRLFYAAQDAKNHVRYYATFFDEIKGDPKKYQKAIREFWKASQL